MSPAATPDPELVAAALNRYLLARGRVRRGSPGAPTELATAREDLVRLLQEAGWEPPAAAAVLAEDPHDPAPHRRTA